MRPVLGLYFNLYFGICRSAPDFALDEIVYESDVVGCRLLMWLVTVT